MLEFLVKKVFKRLKFIKYDEFSNTLVIERDFCVRVFGNLYVIADGHIINNSGFHKKDENLNVPFSIWNNTSIDEMGNPILNKKHVPYNKTMRFHQIKSKMRNSYHKSCSCSNSKHKH